MRIIFMDRRKEYINPAILKLTALIHLVIGSIVLVISGFILFALPAYVFYFTFLVGFYLFLPGVVISFSLVNKHTSQKWARYMIPLWKLVN